MFIRPLFSPSSITHVAFSGGVDSVCLLNFLRKANHNPIPIHFHHGEPHDEEAYQWIKKNYPETIIEYIEGSKPPRMSVEHWWRQKRYDFFQRTIGKGVLAFAHHLDDCVETWIFSCANGNPDIIPPKRKLGDGTIVRPFLSTPKENLIRWCEKNNISWIQDETNFEECHVRNIIRHSVVPQMLRVNPGLATVVKKKVEEMVQLQ